MLGLEVLNPGVLSLVQDLGRFGVAHLGLSQGGPADLHAFCWGNRLLNNPSNSASIEIALGQASFKALADLSIAITGADMGASIDGISQANWQSFRLLKHQTLRFSGCRKGQRAYLSIEGGVQTKAIFDSVATVVRNQLGGLAQQGQDFSHGKPLQKGDKIAFQASREHAKQGQQLVPTQFIPDYSETLKIGVIESYQNDAFEAVQKHRFYQSQYVVTAHSDRMGIQLKGPKIESPVTGIISEGIVAGSIQIPANGLPIILACDRQTLGGYAKLGSVIKRDQWRLAQAKPGTKIHFEPADLNLATQQWMTFMRFFGL
ncbi:biotin-dependent carboxyltransferase [Alginatibacterium sediminis]|uniref:Biotin-dependent carboxyltransferase n=1 Tax=Alginatibacterium sediminis TaxID=2164068 RepID=A0A420EBR2_9ALTE|nr:biotin-dependent carboxyltransferase family protein [Alginatibacterium sediminis]RKF18083.1 biotin-dependent carboxyltransferase [Alginatibacterium sediminis]